MLHANRFRSLVFGAATLLSAGMASATNLPPCDGGIFLVGPGDHLPGYVILTTGRTTTAFLVDLAPEKNDIVHQRSCGGGLQVNLTLGKEETDCEIEEGRGCAPDPGMPLACPSPETGLDDALRLLSCMPTPTSKKTLDVSLRLYYAGLAPTDPRVYFGIAGATGQVYSSWDPLPQTTDVECAEKIVQLPRAAGTYFIQVTLLDTADPGSSADPPTGVHVDGDTENWSIVVTYDRRTKLYSAALFDSLGVAHGALSCPPPPPAGGGHGHGH